MGDTDPILKARMRLGLRAQRAFGLDALPLTLQVQPATAVEAGDVPPAAGLFGAAVEPAQAMRQAGLMPPPAREPFAAPELSPAQKQVRLAELDSLEVRGCTRCRLCQTRTNTVFGEGAAGAKIFFIGEGPGENEDRTGRPFVGRAGELLDRMIAGMGLTREQVYIANIVKCRPPGNREPAPDEVATCTPYLERQLEIVRPRVIVTLGRPALQYMLGQKISISKMRGQWQTWRGIRLMPTFHPAYILRQYTAETRAAVWSDLQQVMAEVGLPAPKKKAPREVE